MDLLSPDNIRDPHPALAALRSSDPVHWSEHHRAWLLTRYDDVREALRDPAFSSERHNELLRGAPAGGLGEKMFSRWMVFRDPPVHTRLRQPLRPLLTPRAVERLRPRVAEIAHQLLDDLGREGGGDLVSAFAFPLPAMVIAELLGAAPEDRPLFRRWSEEVTALVFRERGPDRYERSERGLAALCDYLRATLERRRRAPQDDLISHLLAASEEGRKLDGDELIASCAMLLIAGHDTTASLLASAVWALDSHIEERAQLRRQPTPEPAALEELFRYEGPAKAVGRVLREDRILRGATLRRGQRALLVLAAANRDPAVFADPDRLDLGRTPNPHLAFGLGTHVCPGAPLARLETGVALGALYARFPGLRLHDGDAIWRPTLVTRALSRLPVSL